MVTRHQITDYLADYLDIDAFQDYCVNGLQVEGSESVTKIVTGVSAGQQLFQAAVDMQADMIIVHHGLFWKSTPSPFSLTGLLRNRVKLLLNHNINFAAYHLPLDAHPVLGNNARILRTMGFPVHEPFDVGFVSRPDSPLSTRILKSHLDKCLPSPSTLFGHTQKTIKAFAVVSGGGSGVLERVANQGLDALITGETSEPSIRAADELGISLYRAGHYNSERPGPIALADHLSHQFSIPVHFVDIPNPV